VRCLVALIGVLSLLVAVGLSRPAPAAACTGCSETLADLVKGADRIDLVEVRSATTSGGYVFLVQRVFKGPPAAQLTFPIAGALQAFPVGTRWILVLAPGHGLDFANAFAVEPDGRVLPGGPFDVPATLAGWDAAFGLPATDTAPGSDGPMSLLAILAIVGGLASLSSTRRLGHAR